MGLLLHYSPKFNNNVFLFVAYYLILNGWFIKLSVQTFQPLISYTKESILCIIIGDVPTSIYRSLSYPFRYLSCATNNIVPG